MLPAFAVPPVKKVPQEPPAGCAEQEAEYGTFRDQSFDAGE